jgi:hypothetical protein
VFYDLAIPSGLLKPDVPKPDRAIAFEKLRRSEAETLVV